MEILAINILAIMGTVIGFITLVSAIYKVCRQNAYEKQIDKNMEEVRYYYWLQRVGLRETAVMFNEFGITISLGEEV